MKKISFVIPCFRSEHTISRVVAEIQETMARVGNAQEYEIILVNDCSPDATFGVIQELCRKRRNIIGLSLARNSGQASATLAGFAQARGDIIVYADDDGQTPIDEVFKLIDKLGEGYDVVFGKSRRRNGLVQSIGGRINDAMASYLIGKPKGLQLGNFWVGRRFVVEEAIKCKNPFPYIGGLLLSVTRNMADVSVESRERLYGESNYTLRKMISLWLNGFTAFSVKPLRVATLAGILSSISGFVYMLVLITMKIRYPSIPMGYSSIMSMLLFIGGMLMLILGLCGEYIGRIYININSIPQYVVRDVVRSREANARPNADLRV